MRKNCHFTRIISNLLVWSFLTTTILPPQYVHALSLNDLPKAGTLVKLSDPFRPAMILGLTVDKTNPFKFDFIIDNGDQKLSGESFNDEAKKLIKYFLASLTIQEKDLWVNLSPQEKDRITTEELGVTEMGRDLLAQDYLLKQIMSSLTYPEDETGRKFWERVYAKAQELYGTTENVSFDTFNKVWIVPDEAEVYETNGSAFVMKSHLKVMMDRDYVAEHADHRQSGAGSQQATVTPQTITPHPSLSPQGERVWVRGGSNDTDHLKDISSQITKEILIPEIEKEVNEGKNFAQVRQIYNAVILANWYKERLKESLLSQMYVDKKKTSGVDIEDKAEKEKIWNQYVEAFKAGVYNYIKEDYDPNAKVEIPRKYFSGGVELNPTSLYLTGASRIWTEIPPSAILQPLQDQLSTAADHDALRDVSVEAVNAKSTVTGSEPTETETAHPSSSNQVETEDYEEGKSSASGREVKIYQGDQLIGLFQNNLADLDGVTLKGLNLSKKGGQLNFNERVWTSVASHAGKDINAFVEKGLIVGGEILDSSGSKIDSFKLNRVYRNGELIDVFSARLQESQREQLEGVRIEGLTLDKFGHLNFGHRHWVSFRDKPNAPVSFDMEHGLVTHVRILDEQGQVISEHHAKRIYKDGKLVDVFFGQVGKKTLSEWDGVVIHGMKLEKNIGRLNLAGRNWFHISKYKGFPVIVYVEKGLVVKADILDDNGAKIDEVKLSRITKNGQLVDVFSYEMSAAQLKKLDGVQLEELNLSEGGTLQLANRTWMKLAEYAGAPLKADVEKGLIIGVSILDEEGKEIHRVEMNRIYKDDQLIDVFFENLSSSRIAELDGVRIEGVQLDAQGKLALGDRQWFSVSGFGNSQVTINIEKGLVTSAIVYRQSDLKKLEIEMIRVYRSGELIDAFYKMIDPGRLSDYGDVTVKRFPLNARGFRELAGQRIFISSLYPNADIEVDVSGGKIVGTRIVKDGKGKPMQYQRTGDRPGRVKRSLFANEEQFLPQLIDRLAQGGLKRDLAQSAGETLVRLGGASIQILVEGGILSEQDKQGLDRLDLAVIDTNGLAQKLQKLAADYQQRGFGEEEIAKLFNTHLLPLTVIDRLQRTYNLGRETGLIVKALRYPDVEAWITRVRNIQEARGTLNQEKHLKRYDPQKPLRTPAEVGDLKGDLRSINRILGLLESDASNNRMRQVISGIGSSLDGSGAHSAGSLIYNRLFRLGAMAGDAPVAGINFLDGEIPYQKLPNGESQGDQSQEMAVRLAMNRNNLLFIEGPPGTGKTKVIVEIIRQAVRQGKRVLLVSQMHQAVDNALERLMEFNDVPVLRLGNDSSNMLYGTDKVWPGNSETGVNRRVIDEFERKKNGSMGYVLAGTNMGVAFDWYLNSRILSRGERELFDIVIMDEASRDTLAGALVPLQYLRRDGKAVFVGDQHQLPPFGLTREQQKMLLSKGITQEEINAFNKSAFEWLLANSQGDRV